ncbi:hypothetical protein BRAO285_850050 [Bradyrhizobium sp. ORS 285]|nr:hypothetical protein BRAO285_850050 [Bradyrhizobium sp. ORS 285]
MPCGMDGERQFRKLFKWCFPFGRIRRLWLERELDDDTWHMERSKRDRCKQHDLKW